MHQPNVSIAEKFYTTMSQKNAEALEPFLHPEIELITPLSKQKGKAAYLEAVKSFVAFFKDLHIRSKFENENQAILVIDMACPEPVGKLPATSLLTFKDGLITRIELFHDTAPFQRIKSDLLA